MPELLEILDGVEINASRLWARHMELAKIGAIPGGGSCRLALSEEDSAARMVFSNWCKEAGLIVKTDHAANMFGILSGADDSLPLIGSGSHLDTQPNGGRFDGVSGVLAALEVIETIKDVGIKTNAPLAVINWTNEEGVRFSPGVLGSNWFVGNISDRNLNQTLAIDGARFGDEAKARGWQGGDIRNELNLGTFIELHIEQGPMLEAHKKQVGIVTAVQGLKWMNVEILGTNGHAGTVPLDMRQDALLTAARIIDAVNQIGCSSGSDARLSVCRLQTSTDGPSTIVNKASFLIDMRHPKESVLQEMFRQCSELCQSISLANGCQSRTEQTANIAPTIFDKDLVNTLENAAINLHYRYERITSGALHDACNIALKASTAMIFVPCRKGISHNVDEFASAQDLAAGTNVLLHAMVSQAGVTIN